MGDQPVPDAPRLTLTTPFARLAAWARSLPVGADLPEEYPCTTQGVADVEAPLTEVEVLRKEGGFW